MSLLRKQLDELQREYRSAKYPGNLTAELLPARRSMPVMRIITAMSGIAALIALVLWSRPPQIPPFSQSNTNIATHIGPVQTQPDDKDEETIASIVDLPSLSTFPDDLPMAPSAGSLEMPSFSIPSMPSMPSLDLDATNSATTQESA